ncbi:MAG TPA: PDZ domain-containing protein [Bacteroidetes bacterium]|nr:PDZ domain-containing protein [Bacteroidota bacterium]
MKRFYLYLCLLSSLFLSVNLVAQQNDNSSSSSVVIVKITEDDGSTTVKKKRLSDGKSINEFLETLDTENFKNVEVTIKSTDNDEAGSDNENLIFIKTNDGKTIELNGDANWQEAITEMDFDFGQSSGDSYSYSYSTDENKVLLGVYPDNSDKGVLIGSIVRGSGAEKAGLLENDLMTAIDGRSIMTQSDLHDALAEYEPGDKVAVEILRNGESMTITSVLTARDSRVRITTHRDPCRVFFGVYVGSYGHGQEGVGVNGLVKGNNWPAEVAGLQRGDRILEIDGIPVGTNNELVTERDKHKPGEAFTFTYLRDGKIYEVDARFKECPRDNEVKEPATEEVLPELNEDLKITDNTLQLEELRAYPNPTFGDLNVEFRGEAVPTLLRIVDINGKVVHSEDLKNFAGYYKQKIDITAGALGTMILTISQNGKTVAQPVMLITRA